MPSTSALTYAALREVNVARCTGSWKMPLDSWSYTEWVVALGGEIGESLNLLKKLNRSRGGWVGNTEEDVALQRKLADELADVVIYLDLVTASQDVDFGAGDFAALRLAASRLEQADQDEAPFHANGFGGSMLYFGGQLAVAGDPVGVRAAATGLMFAIDGVARHMEIDLGAAVVAKFNATSERFGFPERLAA